MSSRARRLEIVLDETGRMEGDNKVVRLTKGMNYNIRLTPKVPAGSIGARPDAPIPNRYLPTVATLPMAQVHSERGRPTRVLDLDYINKTSPG